MAGKKKSEKSEKKPASKKVAAKKAAVVKRPAVSRQRRAVTPVSGQSGPSVVLKREKLNEKEIRVVGVLASDINPMPINGIAATAFPDKDPKLSNSWVRNSLRRLVRGQWVNKAAKGTYLLSETGAALYSTPAPAAEASISA